MTNKEKIIMTILERESEKTKQIRDAKYRQGGLSVINWVKINLGIMLNYDWILCEEGLPRQGDAVICLCDYMLGLGQEIFTYEGDNIWKDGRHEAMTKVVVEEKIIAWRYFEEGEEGDGLHVCERG